MEPRLSLRPPSNIVSSRYIAMTGMSSERAKWISFLTFFDPAEVCEMKTTNREHPPSASAISSGHSLPGAMPWSYQMFDKQVITRRPDEPAMEQAIVSGDLDAVGREMVNLLEPAALEKFPILIWLKERLKSHGAQGVMMSGSGPTVYALFREKKTAVEALKDLRSVCPKRYQVLFSQILDQ